MTGPHPMPPAASGSWADLIGSVPSWVGTTVAGAGVGLGVWLVVVGMLPTQARLSVVIAAALAPPSPSSSGSDHVGAEDLLAGVAARRVVRIVVPAARVLARSGLPTRRITADLAVTGRPPVAHLAITTTTALAGLLLPAVLSLPLAVIGAGMLPAWVWLVCGAIGFVLPDVAVRGVAAGRRVELRRAVGAVLDLSAIALAGGAGVEQALHGAAEVGAGWGHDRVRGALRAARVGRTDPWVALGRLGREVGVAELVELAATVQLAGTEGAKVKASLTAKAAALRAHQQTDAEAAAASATERMSLPVIVLFAGYLIVIGYPALAQVLKL